MLDQGLSPTRPVNPIVFNGHKIFTSPTVFTANGGSEFIIDASGKLELKNNSSYVATSNSSLHIQDNGLCIIDPGSTLILKAECNLNIVGKGKIIIKSGGYLCVEQGANINLQDYNSLIVLEEGAILGANPNLLSSTNCSATITKNGNGSIINYGQDVYIQNETLSMSRYIGGKNIFIGNNVTAGKPSGNVLINNGAGVIFDCREIVLDAGFECAAGASFEVKNH